MLIVFMVFHNIFSNGTDENSNIDGSKQLHCCDNRDRSYSWWKWRRSTDSAEKKSIENEKQECLEESKRPATDDLSNRVDSNSSVMALNRPSGSTGSEVAVPNRTDENANSFGANVDPSTPECVNNDTSTSGKMLKLTSEQIVRIIIILLFRTP